MPPSAEEIVNSLLTKSPSLQTRELAAAMGISRQAAHKHLRRMVGAGQLTRIGQGRATRYERPGRLAVETWPSSGLSEDRVWQTVSGSSEAIRRASPEARHALHYAFTEMLNNAIDHSRSDELQTRLFEADDSVGFEVIDEGIGAFENVRLGLRLDDTLQALQELSKGKVTTRPEAHTGEGIFFVSKLADLFELDSNGLCWIVDNLRGDMTVRPSPPRRGTRVRFQIAAQSSRSLDALFREYAPDLTFSKTRIVVALFEHGVRFVSRSEAKRLLSGLEKFSEIVLDFARVEAVGQGFADEVFRVWPRSHEGIGITPINMIETVAFMVDRARASAES